jgi:hypothetical protein
MPSETATRACALGLLLSCSACAGDAEPNPGDPAGTGDDADAAVSDASAADAAADGSALLAVALAELPYARRVVAFTPGTQAGFGSARFPQVVLGPPRGNGTSSGSHDVLSLGVGGEITLDFGDKSIADGEGPDFVVFENAFWPSGIAADVFAEPAQVSVSEDGENWADFPCHPRAEGAPRYQGCAGVAPTLEYDPLEVVPLESARTGGDTFDLADVGAMSARFVRIRDLASRGEGTTAGFDLDAVGIIHVKLP